MKALMSDNVVQLRYADDKERGTLAMSVGRRGAQRGSKDEIRYGEANPAWKAS